MISLIQKHPWLAPKNQVNCKIPSRSLAPICGPPRFVMTTVQKVVVGVGSLCIMMIIPTIGLYSVPSWAIKHQNLGKGRIVPDEEPAE